MPQIGFKLGAGADEPATSSLARFFFAASAAARTSSVAPVSMADKEEPRFFARLGHFSSRPVALRNAMNAVASAACCFKFVFTKDLKSVRSDASSTPSARSEFPASASNAVSRSSPTADAAKISVNSVSGMPGKTFFMSQKEALEARLGQRRCLESLVGDDAIKDDLCEVPEAGERSHLQRCVLPKACSQRNLGR